VLTTLTGQTVEVLFEGSENFDSGPDFSDAVIKLDGVLKTGDIEVHLDARGWYEHGHHRDSAYNNVILHLISGKAGEEATVEREDGVRVPQVIVDAEIPQNTERPRQETSDVEVFADCPLRETGLEHIMRTLQAAGEARLLQKVQQFREELIHASWEQLFYKKMMQAFGYAKNARPFQRLADVLPIDLLFAEMQWVAADVALLKCEAMLFGAAGLLPTEADVSGAGFDESEQRYLLALRDAWRQISHRLHITAMRPHEWQFFRLRPQNFPTRRLAGAAQVLFRFYQSGFMEGLLRHFRAEGKNLRQLVSELESSFVVAGTGFWKQHYRFVPGDTRSPHTATGALIGKERARDVVVNIVLPQAYLYCEETGDGVLKTIVREAFKRYPRMSENKITRAMTGQLFRVQSGRQKILRSALLQQGAIFLHKVYCRPRKCEDCLHVATPNL